VREGRLPVVLGDRPRPRRRPRGRPRRPRTCPSPRCASRATTSPSAWPGIGGTAWSRSRRSCRWPPCSTASTATPGPDGPARRAARSSAMCASRADAIEGSNKGVDRLRRPAARARPARRGQPKNLAVADPERTVAIVNTAAVPTAAMVTNTGVRFRRCSATSTRSPAPRAPGRTCTSTRSTWPRRCSATTMPTNLLLLGAAYQHGCLPVSAQAIEQAIRLNGAAVDKSLAAFAGPRDRRAPRARRRPAQPAGRGDRARPARAGDRRGDGRHG